MNNVLGDFIRDKRDELDISLREFARKLGDVSPAHISDIERGRRFPSEELLRKIATILRVTVEELQRHDMRPPVDDLRRLVERDPTYGVALRRLAQSKDKKKA
jgi:transcriptional regulator with XRE-family HTH domain